MAVGNRAGGHGMPQEMAGRDADHRESAAGKAGDPTKVVRTVEMTVVDSMRFVADRITVRAGETLRFFVKNQG